MTKQVTPKVDTVVSGAIKAAAQVRTAVADLRDKRTTLDAERGHLQARINHLYALPVNRDDALQCMLDSIDNVGAGFPSRTRWAHIFSKFAFPQRGYAPGNSLQDPHYRRRPLSLKDIEDAEKPGADQTVFSLGTETLYTGRIDQWAPWHIDALYFFFGDLIKAKIRLHFDKLFPDYADPKWRPDRRLLEKDMAHYVDAAPEDLKTTAHERRCEIALMRLRLTEIDAQVEDLDADIETLQASLAA